MNAKFVLLILTSVCLEIYGKSSEERQEYRGHVKSDATALIFADEFKQTFERYLFGVCPQPYKVQLNKTKNETSFSCDLDTDHQDLAAKLATLALRAHSASRSDCLRLGAALASTLGDLARTAANRQMYPTSSAAETKKRKLSKSQKMQIKAKQRTALAVKKKAAAAAAAAAAKITS